MILIVLNYLLKPSWDYYKTFFKGIIQEELGSFSNFKSGRREEEMKDYQ